MAERKNVATTKEETAQAGHAVATWTAPVLVPLDLADAETGPHYPGADHYGCS
jgi:hypothetical protein